MTHKDIQIKELNNLIELKERAKKLFKDRKEGVQLFEESASKLFTPVTNKIGDENEKVLSQSKKIQQSIVNLNNQFEQQHDNAEALRGLPYYDWSQLTEPAGTKKEQKRPLVKVDFDKDLSDEDKKNLEDLILPIPSKIDSAHHAENVLKTIKIINRGNGQHLSAKSKKTEDEKADLQSKKQTLEKYRKAVNIVAQARGYVISGEGIFRKKKLIRQKGKRGRPKGLSKILFYNNDNELFSLLDKFTTAKSAGHNNNDNTIVDILDTLLQKHKITKIQYDNYFKIYFPEYIK